MKLFSSMVVWVGACMALAQLATLQVLAVEPDGPSPQVAVTYRLGSSESGFADVEVQISPDAGEVWTVTADVMYPGSGIGTGVPADGSLWPFVREARAHWSQQYSGYMRTRMNGSEARDAIFFTSRESGNLYRMNLDGSAPTVVASGAGEVAYSFADPSRRRIYMVGWTPGARITYYDPLAGGGIALLHNGPGWGGQGGAYDPDAGLFFVGRYYAGVFSLQEQTPGTWQHLVTAAQLSPMIGQRGQLQIDPVNQQVYFRAAFNGSCGKCRWIWRVNYDGSGLTQIIQANNGDALALDLAAGKMYFTDGDDRYERDNTLNRANLDGSDHQVLLTLPPPFGHVRTFHLDLGSGKIYYHLLSPTVPGRYNYAVGRSNLDGSNFEIIRELPEAAYGTIEGMVLLMGSVR